MKKRLFKYAILALCVLGLVLQPVNIFADQSTYRTYSDVNSLLSGIADYFGVSSFTSLYTETAPSGFPSLNTITSYCDNNNINYSSCILKYHLHSNGNKYVYIMPSLNISSVSTSPNDYVYSYAATNNGVRLTVSGSTISAATQLTTSTVLFYSASYDTTTIGYYLFNGVNFTVSGSTPQMNFVYLENSSSGGGSGGGSSSSSTDIDNTDFYEYMQDLISFMAFNFHGYVHSANSGQGSVVNTNWISVGQWLTILFNGSQNLSSQNISYTDLYGNIQTAVNPFYWTEKNLEYLRSGQELMYNKLNSIASNTNDIGDIADRLEMAFPDNQAAMNDSIAVQILDDTNGTGLTVSKITSAKSDLDDGIDTFEVDSSGITWSNPFTALLNLDWAWFSQTTAQNLQSLDSVSLLGNLDYSDLPYYNSVNNYYDDGN